MSWRWVFLINVPLGIAGTLWGILRLREPVILPGHQRFDWPGSLTFITGLGSLLLAASLVAFPLIDLAYVYALFILGALGLAAFIIWEKGCRPHDGFPAVPGQALCLCVHCNAINGLAQERAVLFVLVFFLQGPYGLDPLWAGIMMAPFGAGFMFVGPISGYLSDKYGSRELATAGLLVSGIGLLGLKRSCEQHSLLASARSYQALMGGGSGLFASPNTNAIMSRSPRVQLRIH